MRLPADTIKSADPLRIISAQRATLLARVSGLEWMTTDEAALYCRFGVAAFEKMVKSIPIPFSRPTGPKGDRRFFRSDLDAAMRSRVENLPGSLKEDATAA